MHTAARKLHSQRGASMLFALLVFFLCLLAGVAALTAAAANAGRYTHLVGEQQQYFSTASALELLQAALDDDSSEYLRTVTVTYIETEDWWYTSTTPTPGGEPTYTLRTGQNPTQELSYSTSPGTGTDLNYFQYLLLQNCVPAEWKDHYSGSGTWPSTAPSAPTYNYTIQLDNTIAEDWAATLYPVHVTVKPAEPASDGSYTLEMDLTTEDGSAYPLHVVWIGEADVQTDTKTEITGDMTAAAPYSKGTRTTTTTLTCTLRWSAGNRTVTFG